MADEKQPERERVIFGRELAADAIADAIVKMVNENRARRGLPPMPKTEEERLAAKRARAGS
jgi:hypothetical protein